MVMSAVSRTTPLALSARAAVRSAAVPTSAAAVPAAIDAVDTVSCASPCTNSRTGSSGSPGSCSSSGSPDSSPYPVCSACSISVTGSPTAASSASACTGSSDSAMTRAVSTLTIRRFIVLSFSSSRPRALLRAPQGNEFSPHGTYATIMPYNAEKSKRKCIKMYITCT